MLELGLPGLDFELLARLGVQCLALLQAAFEVDLPAGEAAQRLKLSLKATELPVVRLQREKVVKAAAEPHDAVHLVNPVPADQHVLVVAALLPDPENPCVVIPRRVERRIVIEDKAALFTVDAGMVHKNVAPLERKREVEPHILKARTEYVLLLLGQTGRSIVDKGNGLQVRRDQHAHVAVVVLFVGVVGKVSLGEDEPVVLEPPVLLVDAVAQLADCPLERRSHVRVVPIADLALLDDPATGLSGFR